MNNGFSWSIHFLLKKKRELYECQAKDLNKNKDEKATSLISRDTLKLGSNLERVAKFLTQAGCHDRLVHLNVHL